MMSMRQAMREYVRRLPTVGFYLHLANCLLSTYITIKSIIRTNEHHTRSIWIVEISFLTDGDRVDAGDGSRKSKRLLML